MLGNAATGGTFSIAVRIIAIIALALVLTNEDSPMLAQAAFAVVLVAFALEEFHRKVNSGVVRAAVCILFVEAFGPMVGITSYGFLWSLAIYAALAFTLSRLKPDSIDEKA